METVLLLLIYLKFFVFVKRHFQVKQIFCAKLHSYFSPIHFSTLYSLFICFNHINVVSNAHYLFLV
jgi:hypothetical protein